MSIEERLKELNIYLPEPPKPAANYVTAKRVGRLVYTSGQDCRENGILPYEGKLGRDLTVEQGYQASRKTAINCLSVLKEEIGSLDNIKQFVKLLGLVNSTDDFTEQPAVINGASDLIYEVFGDKGNHARSAISANSLPFNIPVEIEMIVEVYD